MTKIKRTVIGHPAEADSTRDLTGISEKEMRVILFAIKNQTYGYEQLANNGISIQACLQNVQNVKETCPYAAIPDHLPNELSPEDESIMKEQVQWVLARLESLEKKCGAKSIKAITPDEYSAFIECLQSTYIGIDFLEKGGDAVKNIQVPSGETDLFKEYDKDFVSGVKPILEDIMPVVNAPYSDVCYPSLW